MRRIQIKSLLLAASVCFYSAIASQEISLAGQWKFAIDREDKGIDEKWFAKTLTDLITLPLMVNSRMPNCTVSLFR